MAWIVSPHIVWHGTGDDVQLYDTAAGEFLTFNATAAAIWRRLVEYGEQDAIVAALSEDFGAEDDNQRSIVASDTDEFVRGLVEQGIICEGSAVAN